MQNKLAAQSKQLSYSASCCFTTLQCWPQASPQNTLLTCPGIVFFDARLCYGCFPESFVKRMKSLYPKQLLVVHRVEQILAGLKMDWIFWKPARAGRPSDEDHYGLNAVSPLLGAPCMVLGVVVLGLQQIAGVLCGFSRVVHGLVRVGRAFTTVAALCRGLPLV